jgi:Na+-transporting NADH:ubiquinone oxidoreductase subunit NqrD
MTLADDLKHPAFLTGVGTILGYGVILMVLTAVVFGIPFLIFSLL